MEWCGINRNTGERRTAQGKEGEGDEVGDMWNEKIERREEGGQGGRKDG